MPDVSAILAEIERLYYESSQQTIERDFVRAIELLKQLPDEDTRARAHVYMEGLAEMRTEWAGRGRSGGKRQGAGNKPKER
jgi:hypothetical protein